MSELLEPLLINAHKDGLQTLYRYLRFPHLSDISPDAVKVRGWLEAFLQRGELYLPCAREFNDPFEASPNFTIRRLQDGTPDFEAMAEPLRKVYAPKWKWSTERVLQAERELKAKIESGSFEIEMMGLEARWRQQYRTQYPMCCLSAERDNVLMWAYYASSHSGVCVHIDATLPPFGNAWRIQYQDLYPELPIPMAYLEPGAVIRESLVVKARYWQHEREYRVVNMPRYAPGTDTIIGTILDGILPMKGPQLLVLPLQFIVGLSCGALMESKEIEYLARICHDRPLKIPMWQAKTHKSEYKITFESIRG